MSHSNPMNHLSVVPVTERNGDAFFGLLEEQARNLEPLSHTNEIDAVTRERLLDHVQEGDLCRAFMVQDHRLDRPVTAVTYYPSWRQSLYLEDIVTTQAARKNGSGRFAVQALMAEAQIVGAQAIRWECATSNTIAHTFYNSIGSRRMTGYQTWHHSDAQALPAGDHTLHFAQQITDLPIFRNQRSVAEPSAVGAVGLYGANGALQAAGGFFRSYSTFRAVPGLHLEHIETLGNMQGAARLICALGRRCGQMWNGHYDVTIPMVGTEPLQRQMTELGFAPLSYDGDLMVPRVLDRNVISGHVARQMHHLRRTRERVASVQPQA